MFRPVLLSSVLALALGALAPAAHAAGGDPDGLLAGLPRDARPGVCYARVKTSAQFSPPTPGRGRWVLSPPPPGAPGPLWCLVIEPGAPAQVIVPERFGWIRVLCDSDQTPARISGLQRRLHEAGAYQGAVSGRYDEATAAAVSRFQTSRHIDHGGYLSMTTVEAIERSESISAGGFSERERSWRSGYATPAAAPDPNCCARPFIPPPPPPVVAIPVPAPCCGTPGGWGGGLTWPGKVGQEE